MSDFKPIRIEPSIPIGVLNALGKQDLKMVIQRGEDSDQITITITDAQNQEIAFGSGIPRKALRDTFQMFNQFVEAEVKTLPNPQVAKVKKLS